MVTSEEVGADKPDPRNFELVLKKLGLTTDHSLWMVGDNPATDVVGGRHIGAVTFQKLHAGVSVGTGETTPDFTFDHFKDLHHLILNCLEPIQPLEVTA